MTVDLDELLRLHAVVATPELEQLDWSRVRPAQAYFFEAALEALPELVRELRELREWKESAREAGK